VKKGADGDHNMWNYLFYYIYVLRKVRGPGGMNSLSTNEAYFHEVRVYIVSISRC